MADIIARSGQELESDARVELFELDLTAWGAGVLRFTQGDGGSASLFFGGEEYAALPCQLTGVEYDGQGTLPQPSFSVSALPLEIRAQLSAADNLTGATLTHRVTRARYLDTGAEPGLGIQYPAAQWILSQMQSRANGAVQYKLRAAIDAPNVQIPGRQCLRSCTNRYRVWNRVAQRWDYDTRNPCPYTGAAMFDAQGNPVTDPLQDRCSLQYTSGCRKRYGNDENPFSGTPNIQEYAQ